MDKESYCGNCCWFCFEQTEGDGQCMSVGYHGLKWGTQTHCSTPACRKHFVSREERDRHLETLNMATKWIEDSVNNPIPPAKEYTEAIVFAKKCIEKFREL